jgi:hypothetical protein
VPVHLSPTTSGTGVDVGVRVGVGVTVGVGMGEGVGVSVGDGVGEGIGVAVDVSVGGIVTVGVGVSVRVDVGTGVTGVGDGVTPANTSIASTTRCGLRKVYMNATTVTSTPTTPATAPSIWKRSTIV